jgi:hypothetical protein
MRALSRIHSATEVSSGTVHPRSCARRAGLLIIGLLVIALAAACGESDDAVTPNPADSATAVAPADATDGTAIATVPIAAASTDIAATDPTNTDPERYLAFNQNWVEGLYSDSIDLTNTDSLFRAVFDGLPDEVHVFPSENYYYFMLNVDGRQVWGNIRLPAGARDNGVLSFGYFEFIEFPSANVERISGSKFYTDADGVLVNEVDRFTYTVRFRGKTVTFRFHELDQTLPTDLALAEGETFVQRTFDESGYQFYLLFNEPNNYFLWVLNEENAVPDVFDPITEDIVFGRRSGFAFYIDGDNNDRKVLAGVRQLNLRRNDYYDGPFDQLADNYALETGVSEYMQRAFPGVRGRIDEFGYYTDREQPLRVAISSYLVYVAQSDLIQFVEQLRQQDDPYAYISRGGREQTPVATP